MQLQTRSLKTTPGVTPRAQEEAEVPGGALPTPGSAQAGMGHTLLLMCKEGRESPQREPNTLWRIKTRAGCLTHTQGLGAPPWHLLGVPGWHLEPPWGSSAPDQGQCMCEPRGQEHSQGGRCTLQLACTHTHTQVF